MKYAKAWIFLGCVVLGLVTTMQHSSQFGFRFGFESSDSEDEEIVDDYVATEEELDNEVADAYDNQPYFDVRSLENMTRLMINSQKAEAYFKNMQEQGRNISEVRSQSDDPEMPNGQTFLHICAHHHLVSMLQLCLEFGADVNAQDQFGFTAMQYALAAGYVDAVVLLVQAGNDLTLEDQEGNTAIDFANMDGAVNPRIKKYLASLDPRYQAILYPNRPVRNHFQHISPLSSDHAIE